MEDLETPVFRGLSGTIWLLKKGNRIPAELSLVSDPIVDGEGNLEAAGHRQYLPNVRMSASRWEEVRHILYLSDLSNDGGRTPPWTKVGSKDKEGDNKFLKGMNPVIDYPDPMILADPSVQAMDFYLKVLTDYLEKPAPVMTGDDLASLSMEILELRIALLRRGGTFRPGPLFPTDKWSLRLRPEKWQMDLPHFASPHTGFVRQWGFSSKPNPLFQAGQRSYSTTILPKMNELIAKGWTLPQRACSVYGEVIDDEVRRLCQEPRTDEEFDLASDLSSTVLDLKRASTRFDVGNEETRWFPKPK